MAMKKNNSVFSLLIFAFVALFTVVPTVCAYEVDMYDYRELKEELAIVRDTYATALNVTLDEKQLSNPTWDDIEFELPELKYCKVTEIPGGYKIKGTHGVYKVDMEIKVIYGGEDLRYEVKHFKGTNVAGKDISGEVFRNK